MKDYRPSVPRKEHDAIVEQFREALKISNPYTIKNKLNDSGRYVTVKECNFCKGEDTHRPSCGYIKLTEVNDDEY